MSPLRWSIPMSCFTMVLALVTHVVAARGQVVARVDDTSARAIHPQALEAAVYLELYGHPDTAHRRIEVRAVHHRIELSGTVASESEHLTAERLAAGVAPDRSIVNRLQVQTDAQFLRVESDGESSPANLKRRFTDVLARKFPPEMLRELTLTVYRVDLESPVWVVVLEGTVPSVRDQLAMSESLLFGSPAAAAVLNHTYVAHGYMVGYKSDVSIRVPFVGVDVDRGVDVNVGPLAIRAGGRRRIADDPRLLNEYVTAVRADPDLRNAEVRPRMLGGVLTLEGKLAAADKMRAVALALGLKGVRGVVDRAELTEGGPAYYREDDFVAYLRHRLGEHAAAHNIELLPVPQQRLKFQAVVATNFHAALAMAVIANDAALSELPIEPTFREGFSEAISRPPK